MTHPFHFRPATLLLLFAVAPGHAASPPSGCVIEVSVYDPRGEALPGFQIERVSMGFEKPDFDLFKAGSVHPYAKKEGFRVGVHEFFFPRKLLSSSTQFRFELVNAAGDRVYAQTWSTQCRVRASTVLGEQEVDTYGCVANHADITGKLYGCDFSGDWWARSLPMFGDPFHRSVETNVELGGDFLLQTVGGVRHIVVIGHENRIVKSIAVNAVNLSATDLGMIDVRGACGSRED